MALTLTSRSLKVNSNGAVGLSIYEFLSVSNSNHMSIPHRLGDICTWKFLPISYNWAKILPPPLDPGGIFSQNRITSSLGPREAPTPHPHPQWKIKLIGSCVWAMLLTDKYIHRHTDAQSDCEKSLAGFKYQGSPYLLKKALIGPCQS